MITKLRIENFKSWLDTGALRMAPLTGLFGANSSGKTSILQMLLMLKQTVESPDRKRVLHLGDERSLVDLGTFRDVIHDHGEDRVLKMSFVWRPDKPLVITDPEAQRTELYRIKELSFNTAVGEQGDHTVVQSFGYGFDNHRFGMQRRTGAENGAGKDKYDLEYGDFAAKRSQGRPWGLPAPVKCYGFPYEAAAFYQNTGFLYDFVLAFEQVFAQMMYLGPLREYPHRLYPWSGQRPSDVGRRGEQAIPALLAAQAEQLKSGRGTGKGRRYQLIEQRILEWIQRMGLIHSFSLKQIAENRKDYEFRVKKSETSIEVLITDVGFGVSQILPVLVLCYYVPEGSTILLEQPEIHLHPSVQSDLADVLIDVVKERNVQIIVESHSEHLLRRLQRRIAEEVITPDMTALYFCAIDDGTSKIEPLDIDLFGNITNWPQGFFGDETGDLVAMTEAAMRRRGANRQ